MMKIGLTGNIGSGKSITAKIFEVLNVPVFYSDIEAKNCYYEPQVKHQVVDIFGNTILNHNHEIDLKQLAQQIFSDATKLKQIEAIIHPQVRKKYNNWVELHQDQTYTIIESAILLKSDLKNQVDKIMVVTTPKDIRIERVIQRDAVSKEQVLQRMTHQLEEEKLIQQADFLIHNDNQQLILPQILKIHRYLENIMLM